VRVVMMEEMNRHEWDEKSVKECVKNKRMVTL